MKENVGELDRNIRFVAGGALLATAFIGNLSAPWRIVALLLGTSELITATTRHCPMNAFIGLDTNKDSAPEEFDSDEAGSPVMQEPMAGDRI
jgi:hypothetical protein